jgi:hypothetical protein
MYSSKALSGEKSEKSALNVPNLWHLPPHPGYAEIEAMPEGTPRRGQDFQSQCSTETQKTMQQGIEISQGPRSKVRKGISAVDLDVSEQASGK